MMIELYRILLEATLEHHNLPGIGLASRIRSQVLLVLGSHQRGCSSVLPDTPRHPHPNKNTAREEKQEACGGGRRRWRRRTGRRGPRRDDRAGGDRVVGVGDERRERRAAERVGDGGPVGHVGRGVPGVRAIAPAHAGRKKRRKKCSATTRRRAEAASGRRRRSRRRAGSPRVAGTARPRRRRRGPRRPGAATRRRAPPRGGGAREGPRGVACARKSGATRAT